MYVILFIDSTLARCLASRKGYSALGRGQRGAHGACVHCMLGAIGCNVWLKYVPSGANIANLPSRGESLPLLPRGDGARRFGGAARPPQGQPQRPRQQRRDRKGLGNGNRGRTQTQDRTATDERRARLARERAQRNRDKKAAQRDAAQQQDAGSDDEVGVADDDHMGAVPATTALEHLAAAGRAVLGW